MKKFFASTFAVLLLFLAVASVPAAAVTFTPPFEPNADAVYLVNLDTGTVVYQKNADKKRAPASLTKLMTALLLIEQNLSLVVRVAHRFLAMSKGAVVAEGAVSNSPEGIKDIEEHVMV